MKFKKITEGLEESSVVYHFAKTFTDRISIFENGFIRPKNDDLYFSNDIEDAYKYGKFGIIIYGMDTLNLITFDGSKENIPDEKTISSYSDQYDGVKIRYSKDRPFNYRIFNIDALNSLDKKYFIYNHKFSINLMCDSLEKKYFKNISKDCYISDYDLYFMDSTLVNNIDLGRDSYCYGNLISNKYISEDFVIPVIGFNSKTFFVLESFDLPGITLSNLEITNYIYKK